MKHHPDKVPENEKIEATEKFKVLSRVHALLSDADQRKRYDETGKILIVFKNLFFVLNKCSC